MMFRPNQDNVEPKFFLYQWLSPLIFDDQIMDRMKGLTSPHPTIVLVGSKVFVPLPIDCCCVGAHRESFRDARFSAMNGRWCRRCRTACNTSCRRVSRPDSL